MIASLTGAVEATGSDHVVVNVGGVGYLAFASRRTLSRLPARGGSVKLVVETHVREDHIHLYGFLDEQERAWFRLLTTVQGVGARMALAVLSVLSADELVQAIAAQDKAALSRADGVGPKLATRIVSELKDKVGAVVLGTTALAANAMADTETAAASDAVSALVNLGYGRSEAFGAVTIATQSLGDAASAEALVRAGLKELGA